MDQLSEWGFWQSCLFWEQGEIKEKINWALSGQPLSNSRRITDTRAFVPASAASEERNQGISVSLGLLCRSPMECVGCGFQRPACSIFCFEEKVVELST